MDIRLYFDTCTSERRRDARVGVRMRRVRARCARVGLHQGTVAAPNASECLSRACGCVFRACVATFHGFGPIRPHVRPFVAQRARAARARGARQVHRLHEGEGAPRVARPVQALGDPVRPASAPPPCAFALPRARCRAGRRAGPRGVGCGGGGVAGRRPSAEPRARMAGARGRPARDRGRAGAAPRGRKGAGRYADNSELAALPAEVEWPKLKTL